MVELESLGRYNVRKRSVSVVMAGRNDNYGGDFLGRLNYSLASLAYAEELLDIQIEVVLVDWNPPSDRPPLSTVIGHDRPRRVRVIVVPPDFHRELGGPSKLPMFEYLAKNVGIRRAEAEQILVTNPDIIFTPSAISIGFSGLLEEKVVVRVDRSDTRSALSSNLTGAGLLNDALGRVEEVWTRGGMKEYSADDLRGSRPVTEISDVEVFVEGSIMGALPGNFAPVHLGMPGDYMLMTRNSWLESGGYWERTDTHTHLDTYFLGALSIKGYRQLSAIHPYTIVHQFHGREDRSYLSDLWETVVTTLNEWARTGAVPENPTSWGFSKHEFAEVCL